jgi:hypothetical protein
MLQYETFSLENWNAMATLKYLSKSHFYRSAIGCTALNYKEAF